MAESIRTSENSKSAQDQQPVLKPEQKLGKAKTGEIRVITA